MYALIDKVSKMLGMGDKLLFLSFGICMVVIGRLFFQVTAIASFRIPTDSMQPTLQPGDNILSKQKHHGSQNL